MNSYIDIKIKLDGEMRENVLLNKVYIKLHHALFTLKSTGIGVSFPCYKVMLGNVVRLHGQEDKLTILQASNWLGELASSCDISLVKGIPSEVLYRTISRKQANMTEAKLRRLIARDSISKDEVKGYKAKMFQQGMDNPYLELESASNGHKHRRYLVFGNIIQSEVLGEFDSFGLSKRATIPWF